MELFNESKNKYYKIVSHLINKLSKEEEDPIKQLNTLLQQEGIFRTEAFKTSLLNTNGEYSFHILEKEDTSYNLAIPTPIPIRPYGIEKLWLHHILMDPLIGLFLKESTLAKLKHLLEGIENPLQQHIILKRPILKPSITIEKLKNIMSVVMTAIADNKAILYSYTDGAGNTYDDCYAYPYKIEYSVKDQLFYLISYDFQAKRPIKQRLDRFFKVDICPFKKAPSLSPEEVQSLIDDKKLQEPIVLKVHNERNTLERTFSIFSCFHKEATYDKENNLHYISIYYYSFEEGEVLNRIFSLGKAVMVMSPENIREKIIHRIKASLYNYQDENK